MSVRDAPAASWCSTAVRCDGRQVHGPTVRGATSASALGALTALGRAAKYSPLAGRMEGVKHETGHRIRHHEGLPGMTQEQNRRPVGTSPLSATGPVRRTSPKAPRAHGMG